MSKADKMFEELNYKKKCDNSKRVVYEKYNKKIEFDKKWKWFQIDRLLITMRELQAINAKVKELGWDE